MRCAWLVFASNTPPLTASASLAERAVGLEGSIGHHGGYSVTHGWRQSGKHRKLVAGENLMKEET